MTGNRPGVHRLVAVRQTVAIAVGQPGQFAALRAIQAAVLIRQTEYFMKTAGKLAVVGMTGGGIFNYPHVAAPGTGGNVAIGQGADAPHFKHNTFRNRYFYNAVIRVFCRQIRSQTVLRGEQRSSQKAGYCKDQISK